MTVADEGGRKGGYESGSTRASEIRIPDDARGPGAGERVATDDDLVTVTLTLTVDQWQEIRRALRPLTTAGVIADAVRDAVDRTQRRESLGIS